MAVTPGVPRTRVARRDRRVGGLVLTRTVAGLDDRALVRQGLLRAIAVGSAYSGVGG